MKYEPEDLIVHEVTGLKIVEQSISPMQVDFAAMPWRGVLSHVLFYALSPIAMPIMIILSKLLKRPIKWFPIRIH